MSDEYPTALNQQIYDDFMRSMSPLHILMFYTSERGARLRDASIFDVPQSSLLFQAALGNIFLGQRKPAQWETLLLILLAYNHVISPQNSISPSADGPIVIAEAIVDSPVNPQVILQPYGNFEYISTNGERYPIMLRKQFLGNIQMKPLALPYTDSLYS
jgi:hypothetical protein